MNWVKLQTSLLHSQRWMRLSEAGKSVFPSLLMLVGREDPETGALRGGLGPYSLEEIATQTGFTAKTMRRGVADCEAVGLLARAEDGAYVIERWDEKAGESSRDRTRRYRDKARRSDGDVTSQSGHRDRLDTDTEEDTETDKEGDKTQTGGVTSGADPISPLDDDELADLGATMRQNAHVEALRAADELGRWFYATAKSKGALDEHELAPSTLGTADTASALTLLATYDRSKIEAKALGMFAWRTKPTNRMRGRVTIARLEQGWGGFDEVYDVAPASTEPAGAVGARVARLRAI